MLNVVTGPEHFPAAVLIRGVEGVRGPGRVTRELGIDRELNGADATTGAGELWLEDRGVVVRRCEVCATPRIGVAYAGEIWAAKRWRFVREPDADGGESG
jgi:DNA-3-methyladenine glycosylase